MENLIIRHSSSFSTALYSLWNIIFDIRRGLVKLCIRCGTSHSTFSSRISTTLYLLWNISSDILRGLVQRCIRCGRYHSTFSLRISTTASYLMWIISFDIRHGISTIYKTFPVMNTTMWYVEEHLSDSP